MCVLSLFLSSISLIPLPSPKSLSAFINYKEVSLSHGEGRKDEAWEEGVTDFDNAKLT